MMPVVSVDTTQLFIDSLKAAIDNKSLSEQSLTDCSEISP